MSSRTARVSKGSAAGLAGAAVTAAVCVGYGVFVERHWFRRTLYRVGVLPDDVSSPVRVLHLSDLHFMRSDRDKADFLSSLPPADVTVVTGDILGEPEAVETAVAALRSVRGRLASYFVLGSNDYYAPRLPNYAAYFARERPRRRGSKGRSEDLVAMLEAEGWSHINNRKTAFESDGLSVEVLGLDDSHIERHDLRVAPRSHEDAFGLAVVHSPDPVPELVALGYELILSGHTHGGQVRLPLVGALVSNCQLPTKLCMGLSRLGPALLHVSPGLGTSKYAPFRFLCRPEATVLELLPRHASGEKEDAGSGRERVA